MAIQRRKNMLRMGQMMKMYLISRQVLQLEFLLNMIQKQIALMCIISEVWGLRDNKYR